MNTPIFELIARQPLFQLEAEVREALPAIIQEQQGLTRDQALKALEGRDIHQEAVLGKARALWEIFSAMHRQALLSDLEPVRVLLFQQFGTKMVSRLDIANAINLYSHQKHSELLRKGASYQGLLTEYSFEPEVEMALYELAVPYADELEYLKAVLQQMAARHFNNLDEAIQFCLSVYGDFYAARHIKENYEAAQASCD